jgi:FAD synthetase
MVKIMVFGVFDLLHPGHISFLKQAKELGDFLVVSVARDANVKKVKKRAPVFDEEKRMDHIKQLKLAKKVILGGEKDPWPHIIKEKPDIIALGYDQKNYVGENLKLQLQKRGLLKTKIVRLRPFRPEVFKSSIIRRGQIKRKSQKNEI